jgi:hypothetical protein
MHNEIGAHGFRDRTSRVSLLGKSRYNASWPVIAFLWTVVVNRLELRQLAEDRLLDAKLLLDGGRWSGAYYLAGYAMECGLKACVLAFVERTGEIFRDKRFSEKCFTHQIEDLLKLSGLKDAHNVSMGSNASFVGFWGVAKDWSELARYQQKTEREAKELYEAITDGTDGVLQWIRLYW